MIGEGGDCKIGAYVLYHSVGRLCESLEHSIELGWLYKVYSATSISNDHQRSWAIHSQDLEKSPKALVELVRPAPVYGG